MKKIVASVILSALFLCGCSNNGTTESQVIVAPNQTNAYYQQISMEEAAEIIESDINYILLDVRTKEEYESGHIPGAINIPNEEIGVTRPDRLLDVNQIILVYCRSGNRSKDAAQKLANMGYMNVVEFGGIIDWTGETYIGAGRDVGFNPEEEQLMLTDSITANLDGVEVTVTDYYQGMLSVNISNKSPLNWMYSEEFRILKRDDNNNWIELEWEEPKDFDTTLTRLATGQDVSLQYDLIGLKDITGGSYKFCIQDIEVYFDLGWDEY